MVDRSIVRPDGSVDLYLGVEHVYGACLPVGMSKQQREQDHDVRLPDLAPVEGLDHGIAPYVDLLRAWGVETYESCEGGPGHAYPEPAVRFFGTASDGFRALAVALQHALPVAALRRHWQVIDGEPTGPNWELTFRRKAEPC